MAPHSADPTSFSAAGGPLKKDASTPAKTLDSPGSLSASMPNRAWIMGKEAFEKKMPHHEGIKALWETKWKFPVSRLTLSYNTPRQSLTYM